MKIDDMIEVLQAAKQGKKIEARVLGQSEWFNPGPRHPAWNFSYFEYRFKKKPELVWITEDERVYPYPVLRAKKFIEVIE